jgi:hypothetical protein
VLLVDRAPGGEDQMEVLDAVDLVEGPSEDLVGALRAGDTLNMAGPPRDAAVCALLHPAGPVGHAGLMVVRVRAVRQRLRLYGHFLNRVGSLRDHSRDDCLVQTVRRRGLGERLSRLHLVGCKGVGLSELAVAR